VYRRVNSPVMLLFIGMKIVLSLLIIMLLLPISTLAQDDEQSPSLSYLRMDYRSVKVVAHVRVYDAEIVNRIGGYEDWRVSCEVIEPFKGKFRRGDKIEYYHGAESGFHKEWFYGEKIIFLLRNFYEKEKRWVYAVLENSTLPYAKDRVQKLRAIRRSAQRKRRPLRRAQHNN
jgi:hypothetical protein